MARFQIKSGLFLSVVGLLGFALEQSRPADNLFPLIFGALIFGFGVWAEKAAPARHLALQMATVANLLVVLWCGMRILAGIEAIPYLPVSVAETLGVTYVSLMSAFITSTAFQDEFIDEDAEKDIEANGRT